MGYLVSDELGQKLGSALGGPLRAVARVMGGDINDAYRIAVGDGRKYFVKSNRAAPPGMFRAEADGLEALRRALTPDRALIIPEVIHTADDFLVLEFLETSDDADERTEISCDEALGRGLAVLHRPVTGPPGFERDNYIGTLVQQNGGHSTWVEFYCAARLEPQLALPGSQRLFDAYAKRRIARLLARLDTLLTSDDSLSLVHGDLWGGNWMRTVRGPALVDPAAYRGNREIDLAMMHLFGGFSSRVFEAYEEALPLAAGARERRALYQLYPLLVHVNLFGPPYASQVMRIVEDYL